MRRWLAMIGLAAMVVLVVAAGASAEEVEACKSEWSEFLKIIGTAALTLAIAFASVWGKHYLEAGARENGWFQDVQSSSILEFQSDDLSGSFRARLDEDPAAHPRLRAALREKYGLRDLWVGLLVDSSQSLAVQLHPTSPRTNPPPSSGEAGRNLPQGAGRDS